MAAPFRLVPVAQIRELALRPPAGQAEDLFREHRAAGRHGRADQAAQQAASISQFQDGGSRSATSIPHFIRVDFAAASRSVFYAMAIFMAVAAIVALVGLRSGRQEEPADQPGEPGSAGQAAGEDGAATVPPGLGS